jgi:tripartite-type tricarboxylate transporter receptor subunit TctC
VPGYEFELWHGLFAPAKTPRAIVDKIRAALAAAQEDQDTKARFLALGMVPTLDTPEEFATIVRNQRAKDTALARELNLKPQ